MRMVKDSKNCRVLKLVHPGGFVEIHLNPITADEIMKKNPRHCVTRPDVFRFPWIVVRPESVLKPAGVFYIVPFHTIHRLLQRNRYQYQDSLLLLLQQDLVDSSVEFTYVHQLLKKQCPNASQQRTKLDCKIEDWPDDSIFPKCLVRNKKFLDPCHSQESLIKSRFELELFGDSPKKPDPVDLDHWHTAFDDKNHQEHNQLVPASSYVEPRSSFSLDTASSNVHIQNALPNSFEEEKTLKSCLKKNNHARSHGFRVKFALPDEKIINEVFEFQATKSP